MAYWGSAGQGLNFCTGWDNKYILYFSHTIHKIGVDISCKLSLKEIVAWKVNLVFMPHHEVEESIKFYLMSYVHQCVRPSAAPIVFKVMVWNLHHSKDIDLADA